MLINGKQRKKRQKNIKKNKQRRTLQGHFCPNNWSSFLHSFLPILRRKPSRGFRKKTHGFFYLFSSLPPNQIPSKKFSFFLFSFFFSFFPSSLKSTLPNTPKINLHYIFQSYWNELLCIIFYMNLLVISFLLCTNHA